MAIKINFDPTHSPELPTLILAKKNGEKFGVLKYRNLVIKDCLSNPTEINFTIDKYLDGEKNNFWDEVLNFRAVYCKEWDIWFELTIDIDEADSTIKNVACVELSQAELSQIMLYNIEINTETDIEREDYVHPTVLYNKDKPSESLLDRIMEKADHYSIEYVSPTITNIQRTFTFDDMSLYDAFNKIAEEIDCLFVFNSGTKLDGKIARGISVYDLESNCLDCGYRGEFTQKCPKCNSENIDEGYGDDTTIFVTADEIAKNIKLSTDTGAVKNCFKLQAGDDLMTATIRNCNPNGTDYIWYLSNSVKEDMSEELKAKISEYDATYENYRTKYKYEFHPAQVIGNYNSVINTYEKYNSDLSSIPNPIWGYSDLVKEYYNATDFLIYLQSELMPDASLSDTSANLQLSLLTANKLSPVSVTELNNLSLSTADNIVLAMARAIVDLRYEVEIASSSLSGYTWTGRFRVVNYSDEEDAATGTTDISIVINDDYENFLKQKLFETLSKNNENISISGLFDISKSLSEFDSELKKYCLDSLLSFQSICQSCLDILIEQDISASWDSSQDSLYSEVYLPYLLRMKSIEREINCRDSEIFVIQTLRGYIENYINSTHADLDFQNYLGENLWNEFILYRREDKYSNDNYVSDGLNNAEIIQKASEFISVAEKEIFKSAELQHSISASLNDFLVVDKFQPLVDYFDVGNWIRIRIDDEVYKLRLLSYEIDFGNLENISVEFSDVFKTIDGYADQESVISNAAKMSSSYPTTQRQASLGERSQATLDAWYLNGINTATTKIINEADDQCQIWDRHGMLFKKFDPVKNDYNPNQMKIINSTIALTTDNWTTTKMAIGLFKYVDPNTQEEKEVYGVNGETIIGNLLLGKNLNITNDTGSMMFDGNGLTVSNGINTITINPNNTYLFNIKNQTEDLLSFDETDGSLRIVGNIVAKNLELSDSLAYNKLLFVDSSGVVTGVEIDNKLDSTSENPVQNKIITEKIEDIQTELTQTTAKATDAYKAIPTFNTNISNLRNDIVINRTSLGMQKKNLLKLKYSPGYSYTNTGNSVTWTFNSDYSITMVVNTAISSGMSFEIASLTLQPGTYIYSVGQYTETTITHTQLYLNGSWSANFSTSESTFTVTKDGVYSFRLYRNSAVSSGTSVTLFPMLRYVEVKDDSFEPYTESVQEQINDIQAEVTTNISSLQSEVDGLTASVDYMSKYKADTTTVNGVISSVSSLTSQVNTNTSDINDIQTELTQTTAKATDAYKAIPTFNTNISNLQSEVDKKLNTTSREYVPIKYITESKDFNTDFMLTADDPNKVIFSCPKKMLSTNAPFGSAYLPYILIAERVYSTGVTQVDFIKYTCMAVEYAETQHANIVEYCRYYKGSANPIWTAWENLSQGSGGGGTITVDSLLSTTSENPVQNKIITEKINDIQAEVTTNISSLQSEVDGLTASVDYMSKYKADTTTVNGVISNVSTLTSQVNTNTDNIEDIQTELAQTTSKATDVYKAMPTINGYISDLQSEVDGLTASVDYMAQYKAETATVNGVISNVSSLSTRVGNVEDEMSSHSHSWDDISNKTVDVKPYASSNITFVNRTASVFGDVGIMHISATKNGAWTASSTSGFNVCFLSDSSYAPAKTVVTTGIINGSTPCKIVLASNGYVTLYPFENYVSGQSIEFTIVWNINATWY